MKKYSIILPTLWYNTRIYKILADAEVNEQISQVILIDNSQSYYKYYNFRYSKLWLIQPPTNLFVNPAWNLGIKLCTQDNVLILSDDVTFDFNHLLWFLESVDLSKYIVGMDSNNPTLSYFNYRPRLSEIDQMPPGWGCLICLNKNNWIDIPDEIKCWYGDNFLFDHNPTQTAMIKYLPVQTEMSTTLSRPEFTNICQNDGILYRNLKK